MLKNSRLALLLFILLVGSEAKTQIAPGFYYVQFTDKQNSPFSTSNPSAYLSQRAIERRQKQSISISEQDLPVNPHYIDSVLQLGNIDLWYATKWFNGIVIQSFDTQALAQIKNLSFVDTNQSKISTARMVSGSPQTPKALYLSEYDKEFASESAFEDKLFSTIDYGVADTQNKMIDVHILHELSYTGNTIRIAVLDAGFAGADTVEALSSALNNQQIVAQRDLVARGDINFLESSHGTFVLSTMAANLPGKLVGTAPDAEYILVRTEDAPTEYIVEEYNWIAGAEFADSLGADIVNTSLGYTTFDDSTQNHKLIDMDGFTTPISRALNIAASKGMLMVSSAGNAGGGDWNFVGAPADAPSCLTVGAVNSVRELSFFSSRGPNSLGKLKPNICAMGEGVSVLSFSGDGLRSINGTSFSSPIIAGAAACLWQALPNLNANQLFSLIESHGDRYLSPNFDYGYGIPSFANAYYNYTGIEEKTLHENHFTYPNPASNELHIFNPFNDNAEVFLYSVNSILYKQTKLLANEKQVLNVSDLPVGVYIISIQTTSAMKTEKCIISK